MYNDEAHLNADQAQVELRCEQISWCSAGRINPSRDNASRVARDENDTNRRCSLSICCRVVGNPGE